MIVGNLKPLEEIVASIADYRNVLVMGCGGCVSVCLTGGDREAQALAKELGHVRHYVNEPPCFSVETIERQSASLDSVLDSSHPTQKSSTPQSWAICA